MAEIRSSSHEDLEFDGNGLSVFEDGYCWLVALDDWEIAVILSLLRYAHWPKRWRNLGGYTWDEIEARITQLEHCLMAGCDVGLLLDKFDTLNAILTTLAGRFVTPENKVIAEVVEDLELSCGDTTVNFDTEAIVDAIEAQTTMQETRSIAEVTAQNTNFGDLVTAVEGLEFNCAPDVNVDCPPPVVNVQGGGCCGGGGTEPPSDPGTEGEDPPTNWEDPPEHTYDRKCRIANMFYDDLYRTIEILDNVDIEEILTTLGIGTAISMVMAALAVLSGPIGWTVAVLGVVTGIVMAFIGETIDLEELKGYLQSAKEDLVCALYNSTDSEQAKADFEQVLTDAGATTNQIVLIDAILTYDALNALYFKLEGAKGDELEDRLDGYTGSVDCGDCSTPGVFDFTIDERDWEIDEPHSTNGEYVTGEDFRGSNSGASTALLTIYYPVEKVTIVTLRMWIYGTSNGVNRASVLTTDSVEGEITWSTASTRTNVNTSDPGYTMVEFEGLAINDQYVGIYLERFWSNPAVLIQRVEWE